MKESDFTTDMPGQCVKNLQGFTTFVPAPLPPVLSLPLQWVKRIGVVDNMLGRLDGTAKALPDQKILVRSFVRREAQLSSYIENTYARYEEVAAADNDTDRSPRSMPAKFIARSVLKAVNVEPTRRLKASRLAGAATVR